ncbi:MAG: dephospho-CoA kinase [Desulfovibrio sp.]
MSKKNNESVPATGIFDAGWKRTALPGDGGLRLDRYWARELEVEGVSRGKVQEWIRLGLALVDGAPVAKANQTVLPGQELELRGKAPACGTSAEAGALEVLHEDAQVVVLNKPAGLTTHPAPGEPEGTLVNRLLARWPDMDPARSGMDPVRPGIVHRLDKDTSGLILAARTEAARLRLAADFAARRVKKLYLALVHGIPEPRQGDIDLPLGRDPRNKTKMAVAEKGGREARSSHETLWAAPDGRAALVAVRIHTGRTHQVRVHMAAIGCPLLGDATYGARQCAEWSARGEPEASRQMLHAYALRFTHPVTGRLLFFRQDPPEDFLGVLSALARSGLRVGLVGPPGGGKSTLLKLLSEKGLPTFSADAAVAELYAPGGDGADLIGRRFGVQYLHSTGGVDKPALFAAMRGSGQILREVMELVHPLVRHRAESFFRRHAGEVAVAEVPLLLEGGWHERDVVDCVVGVFCPEERRHGAFRRARGLDPETLAVFDSWQWPPERKRAFCALSVENDADLDKLEAEARRVAEKLEEMRAQRGAETLRQARQAMLLAAQALKEAPE